MGIEGTDLLKTSKNLETDYQQSTWFPEKIFPPPADLCRPHLSAVPHRGPGWKASGVSKAQAEEEPSRPFSPMARSVGRLNTARA